MDFHLRHLWIAPGIGESATLTQVESALKLAAMNEMILGIDLGTTNSAVGVVDSGFPILLANEEGRRITPSAVWIGKDGEVEVGAKALRRRALEPERVRN